MPSNPDSQFGFRDSELAQIYDQNYSRALRHDRAQANLKRWELVRSEILKGIEFSPEEAQAIRFALSSVSTYGKDSLEVMDANLRLLQSAITEEIASDKIKSLSFVEWLAVVDAIGFMKSLGKV